MKSKNYIGKIKTITKINKDVYKLDISSALQDCKSGQFVSVLCPNKTLRRPFSICDFDKENKILSILIKLKGEGTKYLSNLKENDEINFLAPMGNGFELFEDKKALLVGAGIGIAPLLFLKKEMKKKNITNYLVSGFKTEDEIIKGSDKIVVGGSVLDDIENTIKDKNIDIIYSCGPNIVLKKLSQTAKKLNIPCYVALERVMACSIGVCRGCIIKLIKNNEINNFSVCKDGPIFKGEEILWD